MEREIDQIYQSMGSRIRKERRYKKITQAQLAQQVGKNVRTIQKYEAGNIEVSIRSLYRIAAVLGCTPDYLIFGDTNNIFADWADSFCADQSDLL